MVLNTKMTADFWLSSQYRLKNKLPLNPYDRSTFYSNGPEAYKGYTDYPYYDQTPVSASL